MMPMPRLIYFSQHKVLRTNDLDEARFKVSQKFCDHRLDLSRRGAQLSVEHNAARGRHVWQVVVSAEAAFLGHGFSGWQRQVNSKTMYGEGT